MTRMEINGAVIVSWSLTDRAGDSILVVGQQVNNKIEIINAFQGREAHEIYHKLTDTVESVTH